MDEYKFKEYELLRTEILQYLAEYQNVRNMMYIITAAILGFSNTVGKSIYLFLLPLVVILPSYIISYGYQLCVIRAAAYLKIFYENTNEVSFKWETQLVEFNKKYYKNHPIKSKINYQQIPYLFCGIGCIITYFFKANKTHLIHVGYNLEIGIACAILSAIIFVCFYDVKLSEVDGAWISI